METEIQSLKVAWKVMELDQDVVQKDAIQWKEWLIRAQLKAVTGKVQVLCLFSKFFRTLSKQRSQK